MLQKWMKKISFPIVPAMLLVIGFLLAAAAIFIFASLSEEIVEKEPFEFDPVIIDAIRSYSSPGLDRVMLFFTEIGSKLALGILLAVGMLWLWFKRQNLWGMVFFLLAVGGGGLLNLLLKNAFQRKRPNADPLVEALGFSFPSGHAMGSMVYYGFLGYLVVRSKRKPLRKAGWTLLFAVAIIGIGISRIYLGVHYPSDIIAGYSAGLVWLLLCIAALEAVYFYKRQGDDPSDWKVADDD
ncbi:phosphatase PAP2 family protein [Fictibacillus sp. KIGAM418]|uniref:Phosphatase PAP2 family protein n=1 Tax=Fictibacillus marinisediminis TaxID=2878389 RepID=A0A9X1X8J6_9BACL|nr:phosphatase PAP2 family protein [Fictibacillus marinisediminis]MCK6255888.1 phosphatase PAP2 family protein [Fictibacillus marinisediminis]